MPPNPKPSEHSPLMESGTEPPKVHAQTAGSIFLLVLIALLKVQLTKFLFHYSNYPTAYSLWSCFVTALLLAPVFVIKPSTWGVPSRPMTWTLSLIVLFTAFDLAFTNIAVFRLSIPLQQTIASTNPFWTILLESLLYRKWQHALVYLTVTLLVVGAVLASVGSFDQISMDGILAACAAVLCSASKYVFTHKTFQAFKGELGALALLFWVDLLVLPIYLAWTLSNGELATLVGVATHSPRVFFLVSGTAALGGVRALTQYLVLIFVSATSMSTATIFTQILNVVISIPIQPERTPITPALVSGVTLTMLLSAFYAFIKAHKPFIPWVDEQCAVCLNRAGNPNV